MPKSRTGAPIIAGAIVAAALGILGGLEAVRGDRIIGWILVGLCAIIVLVIFALSLLTVAREKRERVGLPPI